MQKLPLHPEELRIGFFPAKQSSPWLTLAIVAVIAIAAIVVYKFFNNRRYEKHKPKN